MPPLRFANEHASSPAQLIAHVSLGKIRKNVQGSYSDMSVYNPKGLPVTDALLGMGNIELLLLHPTASHREILTSSFRIVTLRMVPQ